MRILLSVQYDGTPYNGWQIQHELRTIQGEIISAIEKLTGETVSIMGSGRTDAGVHALGQCAHFDLKNDFDIKKIPSGLNFYLPESISVTGAKRVPDDFDARKCAKKKTYIYKMYIAEYDNPLLNHRALRLNKDIDVEAMKKAAAMFVGRHDFRAFMSSGSEVKTTVRTVFSSKLDVKGKELSFKITADGFLYNMVRRIVGAMISVGQGKRPLSVIEDLLNPPFKPLNEVAAAEGLYLYKVMYYS